MTTSILTNDAISTDATFTGATNTAVPSQLAVKTYADTKLSSVAVTAPITGNGTGASPLAMAAATTSVPGYLAAADWTTFNGKQAALGFTPINKAGDTGVGNLSMGALTATRGTFGGDVIISTAAGSNRVFRFQTAGVNRWGIVVDSTAEGGGSAGSDFKLNAYTDAGVSDTVLVITRAAAGAITLTRPTAITNTTASTSTTTGALTVAGGLGVAGRLYTGSWLNVGGNAATVMYITINAAAGNAKTLAFLTGGLNRWDLQCGADAETGADAGSTLSILARTDAGAIIDFPFSIARAAGGAITLTRPTAITNTTASTSTTTGALTVAGGLGVAGAGNFGGSVSMGALTATTMRSTAYTVASLPAGVAGMRAFVSNALGPTFGAAVVGGGAVGVPVYHDGTSWKVG